MTTEKKTQPKPKQWAEAEALWELGEATRDEIAKKLNVTPTAVTMHMKKVGCVRGSRAEEHRKRVSEEVAEAALSDATVHAQRIKETKDDHYVMASALAKLAWGEIRQAKQDRSPLSVVTSNIKAIEAAMNVIAKARIERWAVLGLDRPDAVDTNELPSLVIEELTADQIEELRNRDFNSFEDFDIPTDEDEEPVVQEHQPKA